MSEPVLLDQFGRPVEERSTFTNPPDWLRDILTNGGRSTAGEAVNAHIAMTVMAFFACVRNISEDVTKLPKSVRMKEGRGSKPLPGHPVDQLFRYPSPEMDRHSFWQTLLVHALISKGGFAEIITDGAGRPAELNLLDPSHVTLFRSRITGELAYRIYGMPENMAIPQMRMLHIHGLGVDGWNGYDIPQLAKQLLGAAIALQKYRGSFFGSGAMPSGVLKHPASLSADAARKLKERYDTLYTGADNAHGVMVLEEGMDWQQVTVDPDKAQMVDLTRITVADICRIFRMPPHKIQHLDNATFSNIEHQGLEYDRDTLDPWVDKFKSECEFKLLRREEVQSGVFIHVNLNALMRADVATRTAYYQQMFNMAAMSPNDILELEDRNPVADGDKYYIMTNLIPADQVGKQMQPAPAPPAQPAPPDQKPPAAANFIPALRLYLEDNIGRFLHTERDKANRDKATHGFYKSHQKFISDALLGTLRVYAAGFGNPIDIDGLLKDFSQTHCIRSQHDITEKDYDAWEDGSRVRAEATWLIRRITGEEAWNIAA